MRPTKLSVYIAREKVDCLPTIKTAAFVDGVVILGDGVELTRGDLIMSRTRYYKTQAGLLKMEVELVPKTEAENVSRQIDEAYQNATDESILLDSPEHLLVLDIALKSAMTLLATETRL